MLLPNRRRWGRALAALHVWTVLALTIACGPTRYVPTSPRMARGEGLGLRFESMQLGGQLEGAAVFRVRVLSAPPQSKVYSFQLNLAEHPACEGGRLSIHAGIERAKPGEPRAFTAGDTLVAGFTARDWDLARTAPSRLDVLVEDPAGLLTCVTFPLVDGDPAHRFEGNKRWSMSLGGGAEAYLGALGPLERSVSVDMRLGYWLGTTRLSLDFAPGWMGCSSRTCKPDKDAELNDSPYLPLMLMVDRGRDFGSTRIGLGLGYHGAWARVDARTGRDHVWLHGPVLMPRIGLTSLSIPGFPRTERAGVFLEMPTSLTWDHHGRRAFGLGGMLTFSGTIGD